tara:strand:+ start:270 stop:383 length:114 start_codon:yes stop_codon:yes gene_type:complete
MLIAIVHAEIQGEAHQRDRMTRQSLDVVDNQSSDAKP